MSEIISLILVYVLVSVWQVPKIYRTLGTRELIIYGSAMLFSFVLALLLLADVVIPSPTDGINHFLMEFARKFFR